MYSFTPIFDLSIHFPACYVIYNFPTNLNVSIFSTFLHSNFPASVVTTSKFINIKKDDIKESILIEPTLFTLS